jgi:hypothetical protein
MPGRGIAGGLRVIAQDWQLLGDSSGPVVRRLSVSRNHDVVGAGGDQQVTD